MPCGCFIMMKNNMVDILLLQSSILSRFRYLKEFYAKQAYKMANEDEDIQVSWLFYNILAKDKHGCGTTKQSIEILVFRLK